MNALQQSTFAAALACSLLAAAPAAAQNLTRAQEGRTAVAGCHAACMDRAQTTSLALYARADRLTDLLISDEYHALTEASQNLAVDGEKTYICLLGQDYVRSLDACQAGCVDLEDAYGVRSSHARNRFRDLLARESAVLREVGLWSGYRNSPAGGSDAFAQACSAYWDDGASGSSSATPSRTRLLPALLGSGRPALQRKDDRHSPLAGEALPTVR